CFVFKPNGRDARGQVWRNLLARFFERSARRAANRLDDVVRNLSNRALFAALTVPDDTLIGWPARPHDRNSPGPPLHGPPRILKWIPNGHSQSPLASGMPRRFGERFLSLRGRRHEKRVRF